MTRGTQGFAIVSQEKVLMMWSNTVRDLVSFRIAFLEIGDTFVD